MARAKKVKRKKSPFTQGNIVIHSFHGIGTVLNSGTLFALVEFDCFRVVVHNWLLTPYVHTPSL